MDNPNVGRGPWCGVCEREKGADNHWFKYIASKESFLIVPLGNNDVVGVPVCGEACASKRLSEWMGERLREARERRADPSPSQAGSG